MTTVDSVIDEVVDALRGEDDYVNVNAAVDAVTPPALLVLEAETWLEQATWCTGWVRPAVVCVAGRIDMPNGQEMANRLVAFTLARLGRTYAWERVTAMQAMTIAGVDYLTKRVILRLSVTLPQFAEWPRPIPEVIGRR